MRQYTRAKITIKQDDQGKLYLEYDGLNLKSDLHYKTLEILSDELKKIIMKDLSKLIW